MLEYVQGLLKAGCGDNRDRASRIACVRCEMMWQCMGGKEVQRQLVESGLCWRKRGQWRGNEFYRKERMT